MLNILSTSFVVVTNSIYGGFVLAHSSRIRSIMMEQSWRQTLEAAGHMASAVSKHGEMNWWSDHFLPFVLSWTPVSGMVPPRFRVFLPQFIPSRNPPHSRTKSLIFW